MVAFPFRMGAGFAGDVNRTGAAFVVATDIIHPTSAGADHPSAYGQALITDATTKFARAPKAGDTAAFIIGMLVRPYPTSAGLVVGSNDLGAGVPPDSGLIGVQKFGYMTVKVTGTLSSVVRGAIPYVRLVTTGSGASLRPAGGLEASSDTTNSVSWTQARFLGPADANGFTEIGFSVL